MHFWLCFLVFIVHLTEMRGSVHTHSWYNVCTRQLSLLILCLPTANLCVHRPSARGEEATAPPRCSGTTFWYSHWWSAYGNHVRRHGENSWLLHCIFSPCDRHEGHFDSPLSAGSVSLTLPSSIHGKDCGGIVRWSE